jgi:hypothetical protein
MIKKLAFIASLAAIIGTAACADTTTGPKNDCVIVSGAVTCYP